MKVRTTEQAWDAQDTRSGEPHGWIQWKGTDVCMDLHCACGEVSHVHGLFAYHVRCPGCGRVYFASGHVQLIELEVDPNTCVVDGDLGHGD